MIFGVVGFYEGIHPRLSGVYYVSSRSGYAPLEIPDAPGSGGSIETLRACCGALYLCSEVPVSLSETRAGGSKISI